MASRLKCLVAHCCSLSLSTGVFYFLNGGANNQASLAGTTLNHQAPGQALVPSQWMKALFATNIAPHPASGALVRASSGLSAKSGHVAMGACVEAAREGGQVGLYGAA